MGYIRFVIENRLFLLAGFLLCFTSSFGQTYFISLFAGEIKDSFSLTDGDWGAIYTVGTTLSAITIIWAGALTDRFRVRHLSFGVMVLLALACMAMAFVPSGFLLVIVVYALRLMGQGMMSQLGAVAMSRWFVAARGRAISLASMGFAVGQAVLPIIFVALLLQFDWRNLWMLAAVCIIVLIPVMQLLLRQERTPQSMAETAQSLGMQGKHWTRGELLRHPLFYMMIPLILGPAAWGTALFFQQVHLTEVKGWSLVSFVALMPIYTVSTIAFTFVTGWAVDRFGVKWVVPFQMLPFALSFAVLAFADTIWMAGVGLVIFGMGQGMQGTATTAFWAVFYGTKHLGAIKAAGAALMVFGSAIGPGVTGAFIDWGVDFPEQMIPIAVFYVAGALLAGLGILRYQRDLPG
ncbi:MFS transporter [Roseobacter denitrificans]|uniref:Transmembrane transport protein, putative n=1 Tax=Roseobacter denitrificans (strain ATCC 33942 / OCh 114) TaxID=375451 RepID=Q16CY3_ROSDO|nr:MFS transporter [Roseobacter denitrificans]ABG30160.1 transmembrane transport protein, putative [Roseobacter denitrificans OCh 114]AVL53350.1 MFS transporter [Roseobacter denitrificans]SFF70140.1 Predicted arabinose efflux permease, MFS family [Roseobacter denitrificans OCh 114]